jgi:hypothetical protein
MLLSDCAMLLNRNALAVLAPWLCAVESFKILYTGRAQAQMVIARRKHAVRGEHQGRALRGQHPMGEKRTFFGYFLAFTKKLPAGRRTAEALALSQVNQKSLDFHLRKNDEQHQTSPRVTRVSCLPSLRRV